MGLKTITLLFLLISLLHIGTSLDCYRCSTQEQGDACMNPKEGSVEVVQCQDKQLCVRMTIKTPEGVSYVRDCGTFSFCLQMQKLGFDTKLCRVCSTNLCNV